MTTDAAKAARSAGSPATGARARIGLALAGGGPLGGIYEIGALLALGDSIEGLDFAAVDVCVGVSSGGFVAAGLANGMSPAQMYRLFIDGGRHAALTPELFLKPALAEFGRRASSLPRLAWRALRQFARDPAHRGALEALATLAHAMPTGLFDNHAIERFLARLFAAPGRSDDFRRLAHRLFIVATNLDTGQPVAFGSPGYDHVPISRAVEASAALPGLFPPVEIDGAHYVDGALNKTLNASLALDCGLDLLVCINPLVPLDASAAWQHGRLSVRRLARGGLPLVLSQTFRAVIHSRMQAGMDRYAAHYPGTDIVLFEPAPEDVEMFFARIFSYAQRRRLCAIAFESVRAQVRARRTELAPRLARHGLRIRDAQLDDRGRAIAAAVDDPRPLHAGRGRDTGLRAVRRDLEFVLRHLEREVEALRAAR